MTKNLEERIENLENKSNLVKISDFVFDHPVISSPLGGLSASLTRIIDEILRTTPHSNDPFPIIGTGILGLYPGYKIIKTIGDYLNGRRSIFMTRGSSIHNRIYNWFLDNEDITGLLAGSIIFSKAEELEFVDINTLNDKLLISSLASILTTAALRTGRYLQIIKKRKHRTIVDTFTNPLLIASAYAYYKFHSLLETINNSEGDRKKGLFYVGINTLASFIGAEFIATTVKAISQRETIEAIQLSIDQIRYRKDRERVIEIQEEKIKKSISQKHKVKQLAKLSRISRKYFNETKEEKYKSISDAASLEVAREIFRENINETSSEFLRDKLGLGSINLRTNDNITDAVFYIANCRWKEAAELLKEENDIPSRYLYARVLQKRNKVKAEKELRAVIGDIISQEGIEEERDKESKNKIYKIKHPLLGKEIIIKKGENLERELETALLIRRHFREDLSVDTYTPIAVVEDFYVMERELHPTLAEIEDTDKHLDKIIEILAKVHKVTRKIKTKPERDLEESIKTAFESYPDEFIASLIRDNLEPLIVSQGDVERVVKKDPHPWNFLVDEKFYDEETNRYGKYYIIDTEVTELTPITTEWAVFLFHKRLFQDNDLERKINLLKDTIIPKNKREGNIKEVEAVYILATYNSTISRTLELLKKLSERKEKSKYRKDMLEASLYCLERIKEEFPLYYNRFRRKYGNLERGLEELQNAA